MVASGGIDGAMWMIACYSIHSARKKFDLAVLTKQEVNQNLISTYLPKIM